jgi:PAS domain S-box-containing protein
MNGFSGHFSSLERLQALFPKPLRKGAWIAPLLLALLLLPLWWQISLWYEGMLIRERRAHDAVHLTLHGSALSAAVNKRFALLEGLYAFATLNHSPAVLERQFEAFAAGLHTGADGIRNFSLAPGGVQRYVYPFRGNEAALGHDLLSDPRPGVGADVRRAVETRKMALSGPYELRQGGLGLVARKALFVDRAFWGLATMAIDIPPLFREAGLDEQPQVIDMALRTGAGELIFGNAGVLAGDPVALRIELPEGHWELAGIPPGGWRAAVRGRLLLFRAAGLIIAFLLVVIARLVAGRHGGLKEEVGRRTAELTDANERIVRESEELKKAAADLRRERDFAADILESLPGVFYMYDEGGRFLRWNGNFERVTGYTGAEIARMSPIDFFAGPDKELLKTRIAKVFAEGKADAEADFVARDGTRTPYYFTGLTSTIDSRPCLIGVGIDISARKQAESALRESEERYRSFFNQSIDAVLLTAPDGRILQANPEACRIFGRAEEEILRLGRSGVIDQTDPRLPAALAERDRTGRFMGELNMLRGDGSSFPAEISSAVFTDQDGNLRTSMIIRDMTERRQTEQARVASEVRFRRLMEMAPVPLCHVDKNGAIIFRNERFVRVFGYTQDDVPTLAEWWRCAYPDPDYRRWVIETWDAAVRRASGEGRDIDPVEYQVTCKSGEQRIVEISGITLGDDFLATFIDLTGRKRAEEALRQSESRQKLFIEYAPASLAMFDRDMRYLAVSRRWLDDYSLGDRDVTGLCHYDIFPEIGDDWKGVHRRVMAGEVVRRDEDRFERADGSVQWLRWEVRPWNRGDGAVGGIVVFSEDITARKEAEESILRLNNRLQYLIQVIQQLSHTQSLEEIAAAVRTATRKLIGADGATFVLRDGKDCFYMDEDAISPLWKGLRFPLERCISGWAMLHRETVVIENIFQDDRIPQDLYRQTFVKSVTIVPIHTEDPYGAIGVYWARTCRPDEDELLLIQTLANATAIAMENIRSYQELEKRVRERTHELAEANVRLQELDRLKSMFIASMSHELRTPLNSIIGFTGIILMGMSGPLHEVQKRQLGMVKKSANHLLSLINDVIDVSKIESGRTELSIETFDLSALAEEVKESLAVAAADKGLRLEFHADGRAEISSDRRRVRQILVNLVGNAVKFTETGGVAIAVTTAADSAMAVEGAGPGCAGPAKGTGPAIAANGVRVVVRDTGVGMDRQDMERLFQAFSRIHIQGRPVVEGTGLGLYLSRRIAALLGGEIKAESEPGRGSAFTLFLPWTYPEGKE